MAALSSFGCATDRAENARPAGSPERANVWVNVAGGSCVRSPLRTFSTAIACPSLSTAHRIARSGDLVLVKGGTYLAPQLLNTDRGRIEIRSARGEKPSFVSEEGIVLDAPASNLILAGLSATAVRIGTNCQASEAQCGRRATNITAISLDVGTFELMYVDGVVWSGGDVGPADACRGAEHPLVGDDGDAGWAPKNIVIQRSYFHDIEAVGCDTHTECLLVWAADNVTVRRNRFRNCGSTGSMYVTELNLPQHVSYCRGVVIENNWFHGLDDGEPDYVHFESDCAMTIRFNSFARSARPYLLNAQGDSSNVNLPVHIYGNYGNQPEGGCAKMDSHWIFRGNVWKRTKCDSTDRAVAHLDFADPDTNLHLAARANAIDRGWKSAFPRSDIDGQRRYGGKAPDAGADEVFPKR